MNDNVRRILIISFMILLSIDIVIAFPNKTNPEDIQDNRITALETNDTLQQTNNTEQQQNITDLKYWIWTINNSLSDFMYFINGQINAMEDRINTLESRTSNLENSSLPAIYGKFDPSPKHLNILSSGNNIPYTEISNFSFNLPSAAYVSIESSGVLTNYTAVAYVNMTVDDGDTINNVRSVTSNNWEISRVYYLERGNHTIYLRGAVYDALYPGTFRGPDAILTSINVIATDKGSFEIE